MKTKPHAHHVILWDAAGFHQKPETGRLETERLETGRLETERLEWSGLKHVHVITLPAYTPELNPVEKLWDQLKDTVCNWVFDTIEQTRGALKPEMQEYWQSPQKIFSLLGDNWLRQKTNSGYRVILPLFN